MSNYNNLKTSIDANIKQNGNQEITGPILNSVLNQMVNILGTGYQFAGVATLDPAIDPGTPDAKVFYIANGKGTYTNFGGIKVMEDDVVVLYWDSAWHKVATGIASQAKLSELVQEVGGELIVSYSGSTGFATFEQLTKNTSAVVSVTGDTGKLVRIAFLNDWTTIKELRDIDWTEDITVEIPVTANRIGVYAASGDTMDISVIVKTKSLANFIVENTASIAENTANIKSYAQDVIGQSITETATAYYDGSLLALKIYLPVLLITSDTTLFVVDNGGNTTSVSARITRGNDTLYLSLTKDGNKFTLALQAGDTLEVIYFSSTSGTSAGDTFDIYFVYKGDNLYTKIAELSEELAPLQEEVSTFRDDIDSLKECDGVFNKQIYTSYLDGSVKLIVNYPTPKQIAFDCKLIVRIIESAATGISCTRVRGGATQYITMTKVGTNLFSMDLLAGDEVKNLFLGNGGEVGDIVDVIYSSGILGDAHQIADAIYKEEKRWIAIGDSLTAESTLGSSVDNYIGYVSRRLKMIAINKGVGGTGYWKGHSSNLAFYQRILNFTEAADVITIFGSLNDLATEDGISGSTIIGNYLDNTTDTICGCINATIDALEAKYPDALIGIVTPTPWSNSQLSSNGNNYVAALKSICEYRSIPCLDLFHGSNLRPWDESFRAKYYLSPTDGAHPNSEGHKRFSGLFAEFLQKLIY